MKVRAAVLALCLLPIAAPPAASARATATGCPTLPARPSREPQITLPPDLKNTSSTIAFEIDVGSDGRARGVQLARSSGDGAVDLSVRQTLQAAAYDPPQTGCVASSGGLFLSFGLPAPSPAPGQTAAGAATPAPPLPPLKLDTKCTPFVTAFLSPGSRDRKRTGTAIVAVELDAAGTRTAAPVLKKTTGSAVLDAEAVHIAQTAQYNFLSGSACTPQAFTYNLELTFQ